MLYRNTCMSVNILIRSPFLYVQAVVLECHDHKFLCFLYHTYIVEYYSGVLNICPYLGKCLPLHIFACRQYGICPPSPQHRHTILEHA
jgi:hypothetical protein